MPPGNCPVTRLGQRGADVAAGHRPQRQRHAVVHRAGGDRRDDRLQSADDHDQGVDRAAQATDEQHAEHAQRGLQRRADDDRRGQAIGQHHHHADRQVDARGQHHQRLGHRHDRQQHALVGRRRRDVGVQADRMVAGVDREHHDEGREGQQRAPVFAQPVRPVRRHARATPAAWASAPMFKALLTSACSVISAPTSSRLIAPSYITSTRSQQPTSSS